MKKSYVTVVLTLTCLLGLGISARAYFLSKIETPGGVYTIAIPPAMTKLAQMKDHSTVPFSGSN